ncbi:hypothetical protein GCM10027343_15570 [Noviherbaspirillum agri]
MRYQILIFAVLIASAGQAGAQVYKCKDEKGSTIYSDNPCTSNGNQTRTDIPTSSTLPPVSTESPLSRQLDNAVRRAISNGDLNHAESLAMTAQHWEWIASAKKDRQPRPVLGRTEADLSSEKGGSFACQQAKRDYEFEAGSYKQVQNSIDAKRSIMHAACGIKEPTQIKIDTRTIINQRIR